MASTVSIDLPENLTIANVHPVHEQFEALVDDKTHDHITVRADAVSRADTAGVQLLHALVVAAKDRQIVLEWENPSEKLCAAVNILGMKDLLGFH